MCAVKTQMTAYFPGKWENTPQSGGTGDSRLLVEYLHRFKVELIVILPQEQ